MRRALMLTVLLASCANDRTTGNAASGPLAAPTTEEARSALSRLRDRHHLAPSRGEIGPIQTQSGWMLPQTSPTPRGGWAGTGVASANVSLESAAPFRVESGGLAVTVQARDLSISSGTEVDGEIVHAASFAGASATYLRHAVAQGVEDFLEVNAAGGSRLEYAVALDGVAGVRQVGSVVEFLDAHGTPRLRMANPMIEGADGALVEAEVAVAGCAVDHDPRAPWGRELVSPGATACTVQLSWAGKSVTYPALIDPSWVATGAMVTPGRQHHAAALMANGRVLVSGGMLGASTAPTAEVFDPATRTWAATGTMPGKAAYHTLTRLPSGVLANVGGTNGSGTVTNGLFLYDPALGTWSSGASLPNAHAQHTTELLADGRLLVVGGNISVGVATARVELYTPSTNTWVAAPNLSTTTVRHASTLLSDGRVLVAGGWNGSSYLTTAQIFNPTTNTWSSTGALGTARADHTLTAITAGLVLAAGGTAASGSLASAEIYNPETGWFTATPPAMATARALHTAVFQPPDQVLVVGGGTATVERYDGHTNTWRSDASLPASKTYHTSTRLQDGPVLTAGAGSAETLGAPPETGDSSSNATLTIAWQTPTGTRAATDLMTLVVGTTSATAVPYTLKVVAAGLDGRVSTRTLGSYTAPVGSIQTLTFPANQLPIQSLGTPVHAELRAEYTGPVGTAAAISDSLHYLFASGYGSLNIFGGPQPLPNLNLATTFGSVNGAYTIGNSAFFNALTPTLTALQTVSGRVFNATTNVYNEVSTLPPSTDTGGTFKGSYPLDGTASKLFDLHFGNTTPVPEGTPVQSYTVCGSWRASFVDAGFGETQLPSNNGYQMPAVYARYMIVRGDGAGGLVSVAKGTLSSSGCTVVQLKPNQTYNLLMQPRIIDDANRVIDVYYRPKLPSGPNPTQHAAVVQLGIVPTTVIDDTLVTADAFVTAASGGFLRVYATFEDQITRAAAVMSRALLVADSGIQSSPTVPAYRVVADAQCDGAAPSPTTPSACAESSAGYPTLFLGPFNNVVQLPSTVIATHNTLWKFIIGHEFGHLVQGALTGQPGNHKYKGPLTGGLCGCNSVVWNPEDQGHCLQSQETTGNGQGEGFGHFYASKLMNDLTGTGACKFVYYKRSWNPTTLVGELAPQPRTCDDLSVRWLDNHCGGATATGGVEWDWLNFYATVHRGTNATTMTNFSQIYRQACTGSPTGPACNGSEPAWSQLSAAASVVFGSTSDPRAQYFLNTGTAAGVNHAP